MMARPLTIGYVDGAHFFRNYLCDLFHTAYNEGEQKLVFTDEPTPGTCDIICYSFWGETYRKFIKHHKRRKLLLIFVSMEPMDVSRKPCDILIDTKRVPQLRGTHARFLYVPFYVVSFWERCHHSPQDLVLPQDYAVDSYIAQKTKFCAFMYSNCVEYRENVFRAIDAYKSVDALGRSMSDRKRSDTTRDQYEPGVRTYLDIAVETYRPYKFVICCENNRLDGYITEKLTNAMLAHAIPIYWGSPEVVAHFNPRSFIDLSAFSSLAKGVEYIRRIDSDPEAYRLMLKQPWLRGNQLSEEFSLERTARRVRDMMAVPKQ